MSMLQGERRAPVRREPAVEGAECAAARAALGRLHPSARGLHDDPELADHLARCSPCNASHREALLVLARAGRTARRARAAARERERRRERGPGGRGLVHGSRTDRALRLRMMLIPALAMVLMTRVVPAGLGAPPAALRVLAGSAQVGEVRHELAGAPGEVRAGSWCSTAPECRAVVDFGSSAVELEASTALLVENTLKPRVRLAYGGLRVEGDVLLSSVRGVVHLERGVARVTYADGLLDVAVESGVAQVVSASAERTFTAGESCRLGG